MNGEIAAVSINNNNNGGNKNVVAASKINNVRIAACSERLAMHLRVAPNNDLVEFFNLCLSLSRGIDYAISNKEVPSGALELPLLLKQVCRMRNGSFQLAPILVLMISVKNACECRWFSDQDTKELCSLANEILSSFCSTVNFNTQPISFLSSISTIMSRFYPRMKMGEILTLLEVKSGYGTYVHDFKISKDREPTPEKIKLFVAQIDNLETSSCLITPVQANILLNGVGVERRNNIFLDPGPQIPTPVYKMLKYGTNLLQAVGQFNGHYIIVIAFMSMMPTPDHSSLEDYVQPTLSLVDSDPELVEGPSRISLNCPISFRRLKVPVKGKMCNHLQCFDYENYVEINSRRPSWRCPHCSQFVCYTDLRIDQNLAKVLKEVGENVNDVIISSDGSWKAVTESDGVAEKPQDKATYSGKEETAQSESSGFPTAPADVLDLTVDDYEMDTSNIQRSEDRKASSTNCQSHPDIQDMTIDCLVNSTNEVNQNTSSQIEDGFWSGVYLSACGSEAPGSRSESQIGGSEYASSSHLAQMLTGLSEMVSGGSSAVNQDVPFNGNAIGATSVPHSGISPLNTSSLQQYQFGNTTVSSEYARFPLIPRHVSRVPNTVQALAVPSPTSSLQQTPTNNLHTVMQNPLGASPASDVSSLPDHPSSTSSNVAWLQQFSRTHSHPLQGPSQMATSTLQQYRVTQANGLQSPRGGPNLPPGMRPPSNFSQNRNHPSASQTGVSRTAGVVGLQQAREMAAVLEAARIQRYGQTSRAAPPYTVNSGLQTSTGVPRESVGGVTQPVARTDVSMDLQEEQNWRPTGRMRGSLSGRAYSEAFNQFIVQPAQQAQANRPVSHLTTSALTGSNPYTGSATPSGVLPDR